MPTIAADGNAFTEPVDTSSGQTGADPLGPSNLLIEIASQVSAS